MKKKNLLFILCSLMLAQTFAQTWNGSAGNSWTDSRNWTPAIIPNGGSTITIPGGVTQPLLPFDLTLKGLKMDPGSSLDFYGQTLTITGAINLNGATLNSTIDPIYIIIEGSDSNFIGNCTINTQIYIKYNGNGDGFYEGYHGANNFKKYANFDIGGAGNFYTSYKAASAFNEGVHIGRSIAGPTYIFNTGATIVESEFSYYNRAGGLTSIHQTGDATVPVNGRIDITLIGSENSSFSMRKIKNSEDGGIISVLNTNKISIENDTILADHFELNGFESSEISNIRQSSINASRGNILISDGPSNTGPLYISGTRFVGTTNIISNSAASIFEGYEAADRFDNNTEFTIQGPAAFYSSYKGLSTFHASLAVRRRSAGPTYLFNTGAAVTGDFDFNNDAGGLVAINPQGIAAVRIGGKVSIYAKGTTNSPFTLKRMTSITAGGFVGLQNVGPVVIENNSLLLDGGLTGLTIENLTGEGISGINDNSITGGLFLSERADNMAPLYMGGNTINGSTSIYSASAVNFYEGYQKPDIFNGNTLLTIRGSDSFYTCYASRSTFNGNVSVFQEGSGPTYMFNNGAIKINGNFYYYSSSAGGATNIHQTGNDIIPISGTFDIHTEGTGNPGFTLRGIKNLANGGTISLKNSGRVLFENDTLLVNNFDISGFAADSVHDFNGVSITGKVTLSDGPANLGSIYLRKSSINGDFTYTQNSSATFYESYQGGNTYNGDVNLVRNDGVISFASSAAPTLNQNLLLNSAAGITFTDTVKFAGNSNAVIEQLGTQAVIVTKLAMQKTAAAGIALKDSLTITGELIFSNGNINASATTPLIFADNAFHTGASAESHVMGTVAKTGNDIFTFPIGTASSLNPVSITAPAAGSVFTAAYLNRDPSGDGFNTGVHAASLLRISSCEYWDVQRRTGNSNVGLDFGFGAPCRSDMYVTDPTKLRIAHWTGATWEDLGNGGSTGTTSGTISTATTVGSFSPFTLASVDIIANPLPVTLVMFAATKKQEAINLQWNTEKESGLSHFEVEKSSNGSSFTTIGTVTAGRRSSSNQYSLRDAAPFNGLNLYRLKMVDKDGNFTYSKIEAILFGSSSAITILPNPAKNEIRILSAKNIRSIRITDVSGRLVKVLIANTANRYSVNDLRHGIYLILVADNEKTHVSKLMIQ